MSVLRGEREKRERMGNGAKDANGLMDFWKGRAPPCTEMFWDIGSELLYVRSTVCMQGVQYICGVYLWPLS